MNKELQPIKDIAQDRASLEGKITLVGKVRESLNTGEFTVPEKRITPGSTIDQALEVGRFNKKKHEAEKRLREKIQSTIQKSDTEIKALDEQVEALAPSYISALQELINSATEASEKVADGSLSEEEFRLQYEELDEVSSLPEELPGLKRGIERLQAPPAEQEEKFEEETMGAFSFLSGNKIKIGEEDIIDANKEGSRTSTTQGERRIKVLKALLAHRGEQMPSSDLWREAFGDEPYDPAHMRSIRKWLEGYITHQGNPIIRYTDRRRYSYYEVINFPEEKTLVDEERIEDPQDDSPSNTQEQSEIVEEVSEEDGLVREDRARAPQPTHEELVEEFLREERENAKDDDNGWYDYYYGVIKECDKDLGGLDPEGVTIGVARVVFPFLNKSIVRAAFERNVLTKRSLPSGTGGVLLTHDALIRLYVDYVVKEIGGMPRQEKVAFERALRQYKKDKEQEAKKKKS